MINSSTSFGSDSFMPDNEFKKKLDEIEAVNRKEFNSLSESRFNVTVNGEK